MSDDTDFKTRFDPSMLGQLMQVTVIHSRHTGLNYYDSKREDVKVTPHGGRLAEYGDRSFTFEPIGTAKPTVITWPYDYQREWPNNGFRLQIRLAPVPTPVLRTEGETDA